jgi:DNA (cytosine-5)-methyltransferase 1
VTYVSKNIKPTYYNEIDPFAAKWLRNLIKAGFISPGDVDERSIEDVTPNDLKKYTQCHFFAGIGVWSRALRQAGWADDRPVWTGSCPCQPFSAAGKGAGFADERHLWPTWHYLIEQCRPPTVFGEQVASKDGLEWLDLVHADMEASRYAFGAVDLCAAGVGSPNIRQRLWFVADSEHEGLQGRLHRWSDTERQNKHGHVGRGSSVSGLADTCSHGRDTGRDGNYSGNDGAQLDSNGKDGARSGPTNGRWRDVDWLYCQDGKWRAVEPGTFPLAHGAPGRVGRLRAYGNAINSEVAKTFISAYMEDGADEL